MLSSKNNLGLGGPRCATKALRLLAQGFSGAVAGGLFAACSLTSAGDEPAMQRRIFQSAFALAIAYLALYAYAAFTGRDLQPGDPIHIFRKPDAPDYS